MEIESNNIIKGINFDSKIDNVNNVKKVKPENEIVSETKKGTHGTTIENVMRTTSAVYEGSWVMAQREALAGDADLD